MNRPRPSVRRAAGALPSALVASALAALGGCQTKDLPGVFLEFQVENERFRPDAVRFTWMREGVELVNGRLPEVGSFTGNGNVLGSIFIETEGPLSEPRLLAVKGLRGDTEAFTGQLVSGAVAVVLASADPVQRWGVRLEEPLADENGDGKPDVVQRNCLRAGWKTCLPPGAPSLPGAPIEDGGTSATIADGGALADGSGTTPTDASVATLETGLIGHWRLDEGMGTQARDSSGSNNHGTLRGLQNGAWMPGKNGTGLEIPSASGSGVFVPGQGIDGLRSTFTIAAWTFRTSHREGYATVLSRRHGNGGSEHYLMAFQDGNLKGLVNTYQPDGTEAMLASTQQAPLYTWVHVALSHDGATLRLYQDGNMVASVPYAQPLMSDGTPLCLGCNQNGPGDSANDETLAGRLDEVLLYNRALSAAEIAQLGRGDLPRGM
jgi:Concanavalin A-like lectin/glucanases superfamily